MIRAFVEAIRHWFVLLVGKRAPEPYADVKLPALVETPAVIKQPNRAIAMAERRRRKWDKWVFKPKRKAETRKPAAAKPPRLEPSEPQKDTTTTADEMLIAQPAIGGDVRIAESEIWGEFNFRDTILDQLERYFFYLKRMRQNDKEAYHEYRQIGATLMPYAALAWDRLDHQFLGKLPERDEEPDLHKPELPPAFRRNLPGFGCYAYGTDPHTEESERECKMSGDLVRWVPKFLYFVKYQLPPIEIQPMSGVTIYKVTVWWDRPFGSRKATRSKGGVPQCFGIAVFPDGGLKALKILIPKDIVIRGKRRDANGYRTTHVRRSEWVIPKYLHLHEGETPALKLEQLFARTAHWHEHTALSVFRVAVSKGKETATFGVNPSRAPYFFADRETTIDTTGRKQRIFHIVRPHERQLPNGKTLSVKLHFRGLRRFKWAGYDVSITVPGLHHLDIAEFDVGSIDDRWMDPDEKKKSLDGKQFGAWMKKLIESGNTAYSRD